MLRKYIRYGCEILMNAELWSRPGNERNTLLSWFKFNSIDINKIYEDVNNISTEELRQLYIHMETGGDINEW